MWGLIFGNKHKNEKIYKRDVNRKSTTYFTITLNEEKQYLPAGISMCPAPLKSFCIDKSFEKSKLYGNETFVMLLAELFSIE